MVLFWNIFHIFHLAEESESFYNLKQLSRTLQEHWKINEPVFYQGYSTEEDFYEYFYQ